MWERKMVGFGEQIHSLGSRGRLLIRIRVYAGPAFLWSLLPWSPNERPWFSMLSNYDLLSEMKTASSRWCCCSVHQSCSNLCDPMDCSTPGFPVLYHLPELAQIHVHWVSDAIQTSHPLSSPSPPAFNISQHWGLFQSALCIRWRKYWSFSINISPVNGYSGLISFRIDWLDLLEVQETLKSLLQCQVVNIFHLLGVLALQKSSKILWCVFLKAEPGSWLKAVLLFLNCSSPIPASPPFPGCCRC